MKKVFAVFSMLLLIFVPNAPLINSSTVKALETAIVRVVPENMTVKLGQPFSVNITFENLPYSADNGVTGCEFNITWNASILQGMSMKEIAFHAATPQAEWWNIWNLRHEVSNGSVSYAYCWIYVERAMNNSYAPLKGNGTWASVTFVSRISGETELHFSKLRFASMFSEIEETGVDGKVSVTNILAGDINQDKTVNSIDTSILSAAFGSTPYDSQWNSDAAINGDSTVDIYDAMILAANYGRKAS